MTQQRSTLIPPSTIRFERLLPGPVERIWAYLTESDKRATWLAAGEFDLRVGGRIEMIPDNDRLTHERSPEPPRGKRKVVQGEITRLEPNRALAHTWNWDGNETEVLYELTPRGKDVLLVIHHRLPADRSLKVGVGSGWEVHTGILEDLLKGLKPRGFFTELARVKQELEPTIS